MGYIINIIPDEFAEITVEETITTIIDETQYMTRVMIAKGDKGDKGDAGQGGVWGSIVGDIDEQTDLSEKLRTINDAINDLDRQITHIYFDTTAGWSSQTTLVSEKDAIYVYTDYDEDSQGRPIAAFKVGDGKAYVVDMPFADSGLAEHVNNHEIHITEQEREFWNNKVSCFMSATQNETLVFTTD